MNAVNIQQLVHGLRCGVATVLFHICLKSVSGMYPESGSLACNKGVCESVVFTSAVLFHICLKSVSGILHRVW